MTFVKKTKMKKRNKLVIKSLTNTMARNKKLRAIKIILTAAK